MQLKDAIDKMLNCEEVRLSKEGRRLWAEEWNGIDGYNETGKGHFSLQTMDDRGLFKICSDEHLVSDGWSPAYFVALRQKSTKK